MREPYHYQGEQVETIHVYMLREQDHLVVDAQPEPEHPTNQHPLLGYLCCGLLVLLCVLIPLTALLYAGSLSDYDTTLSRTITLTLSLHPTTSQIALYQLPPITRTQQATAKATGTRHQDATPATGLITFYNGSFTAQTVASGTRLTGKDGVTILTSQAAVIPPATPTTPPTYGTVSVTASSSIAGTVGNIPASDIDQACCGFSILAQNLYPFSGGQDERDIPVLTKTDITIGTQTLMSQVNGTVNDQAQQETKPGSILLPLQCSQTLKASQQPGDQASTAILTLTEICNPLAYVAGAIATVSQRLFLIPHGYHLVSFTVLVLDSHTTPTGGMLTVHAIAYLKQDTPIVHPYHFAGK